MKAARGLLLLWTPAANESEWVEREAAWARAAREAEPGYRILVVLRGGGRVSARRLLGEELVFLPADGAAEEAVPGILRALGERAPSGRMAEATELPPAPLLEELVVSLTGARLEESGGRRRAAARFRVHHRPARGVGSRSGWREFESPLGPLELEEIRWYLERYPGWPFGTFRERARELEARLPEWGRALFERTLGTAPGQVAAWRRAAGSERRVVVEVEDSDGTSPLESAESAGAAALLALPWELLADAEGYLFEGGLGARVVRRIPREASREPLPAAERLRVLLVIARPEEEGVGFLDPRASARPLIEALAPLGRRAELRSARGRHPPGPGGGAPRRRAGGPALSHRPLRRPRGLRPGAGPGEALLRGPRRRRGQRAAAARRPRRCRSARIAAARAPRAALRAGGVRERPRGGEGHRLGGGPAAAGGGGLGPRHDPLGAGGDGAALRRALLPGARGGRADRHGDGRGPAPPRRRHPARAGGGARRAAPPGLVRAGALPGGGGGPGAAPGGGGGGRGGPGAGARGAGRRAAARAGSRLRGPGARAPRGAARPARPAMARPPRRGGPGQDRPRRRERPLAARPAPLRARRLRQRRGPAGGAAPPRAAGPAARRRVLGRERRGRGHGRGEAAAGAPAGRAGARRAPGAPGGRQPGVDPPGPGPGPGRRGAGGAGPGRDARPAPRPGGDRRHPAPPHQPRGAAGSPRRAGAAPGSALRERGAGAGGGGPRPPRSGAGGRRRGAGGGRADRGRGRSRAEPRPLGAARSRAWAAGDRRLGGAPHAGAGGAPSRGAGAVAPRERAPVARPPARGGEAAGAGARRIPRGGALSRCSPGCWRSSRTRRWSSAGSSWRSGSPGRRGRTSSPTPPWGRRWRTSGPGRSAAGWRSAGSGPAWA